MQPNQGFPQPPGNLYQHQQQQQQQQQSGQQQQQFQTPSSYAPNPQQQQLPQLQQVQPSQPYAQAPPAPPPTASASGSGSLVPAGGVPPKKQPAKARASGTGAKKDKPKGEKKTRSKAACVNCRLNKQKCDGPSRIPCRRCELYSLKCDFPPGSGIVAPPPPTKPPPGSTSTGGATNGEPSALVTQKLYEIAARLHSIESALHVSSTYNDTSPTHDSPHSASNMARSISNQSSDDEMEPDNEERVSVTENPMYQINASIDAIVGQAATRAEALEDDYGAPDVLRRGLLTTDECQELFEFFFCSIHPWVMMLSIDDDRDAMSVRARSPLLFHTILVLSTSYSSPFPSQLHTTLVIFVNNILAPQILNAQPHELNTDFLRAIDLLNLFKITQFSTRRAEGKDIAESVRASKVNGLASWMLQGILARTAERLDLQNVLSKFSRAYSASASGAKIPKDIIADLRLYYWLLSNDVHGNVQSGRRCNMEGATALATTRLFSSLQLQPYDTRLAASVEMFEIARPILRSFSYERTRRISRSDLDRYNLGMASWEEHWLPILLRQLPVDPLALSVMCPFAWFITLQYNAAAFVSWKQNRFYATDSEGSATHDSKPRKIRTDGPRGLTEWEMEGLEKCVRAAEGLIFTLSEESRIPAGWRAVQWEEAERADGWRKLVLDESVVNLSKWGMDAITCVAYIFPLVFLCKLVKEGLLTADLNLNRIATTQLPWRHTQKLPRLLELGASFLDAIALNPHHPARSQAAVLRALLDSGIKGHPPSPQLPRHAATVMSPLPTAPPSLFGAPPSTADPSMIAAWQNATNGSAGIGPQGLSGGVPPSIPGNPLNGNPSATSPSSLQQFQQMQQNQGEMSRRSSLGGGMDQALTSVLDGFDPMFGETGGNFWEWGQTGLPEVDWAALQSSIARPN